jgi:hypothetical protein
METVNFEKLADVVGYGNLYDRLLIVTDIDQMFDLIGRIHNLCDAAYKEAETNTLGLTNECQISYLEDVLYKMDTEFSVHSVRTHTTRWEAWLKYYLRDISIKRDDGYTFDNHSNIQKVCNKLAVRALIEHVAPKGVSILVAYQAVDILRRSDVSFLKEFTEVMVDVELFELREKLYRKYVFKGGKRIAAWIKWNDEKNHYHHLSETSVYGIVNDAIKYNGSPPNVPPVKWLGSGVELLDLFAALSEKGYINLPPPGESGVVSLERISKAICGLFDISGARRSDSKSEDWVVVRQYFKETSLDKITRQRTYDRLSEDKRGFDGINPVKPRRTRPK